MHITIMLAGQAPVSGHLSPTPLVAAYNNHSRKWPAPVADTFFASRGCRLMRASTVVLLHLTLPNYPTKLEENRSPIIVMPNLKM